MFDDVLERYAAKRPNGDATAAAGSDAVDDLGLSAGCEACRNVP